MEGNKIDTFVRQESSASKSALDEGLAKKLWEKSEALVGLSPEEADFWRMYIAGFHCQQYWSCVWYEAFLLTSDNEVSVNKSSVPVWV